MIDLSKLEEIKDTITNVANAISMVLNVDVVIVDDKGNFIAAQENYIKRMGEFQFKKFSSLVCTAGEALMIQNPGNHLFCKGCPNEVNCPQLLEMIVPLKYYGTVVGIISIICFSEKQVEEIKRRKKNTYAFLSK